MRTEDFKEILRKYWGYQDFRSIQLEIINSIAEGKDTLGLMPTGGGKSITFQVPALAMDGVCLVITPLIALMKDQVANLKKRHIKAAAIYSGLSREQIISTLENCIFGAVKILYISPERLSSNLFLTKLRHINVSFITVDEAHCITQWGYDFRPSYLKIADIRDMLPGKPILALTATATPDVVDDIQDKLHFRAKNVFSMSFERTNLAYIVRSAENKSEEIIHILNKIDGCAIIYVRNRKETKELAEFLCQNNISATYYHAGLADSIRDERQRDWQMDKTRVMVATNAFGMGIDKPDVRVVIHIEAPDCIESYFQEAGRAGRDGKMAYAILLSNRGDILRLKKRAVADFPEKDYIRKVYEHIACFFQIAVGSGYGMSFKFNIQKFCRNFKHYPTQVEAALRILEQAGYIEYNNNDDAKSRVMFILQRDELYRLRNNSQIEDTVIETLLRKYNGLFVDYGMIDEEYIAHIIGCEETEVHECLKLLGRKQIISYIPPRDEPLIRYLQSREMTNRVSIPYYIYEERLEKSKERTEAMISYMTCESECRSVMLLNYFGEKKVKDCGMCDVCSSKNNDEDDTDYAIRRIMEYLSDGTARSYKELRDFDHQIETSVLADALDYLLSEEKVTTDGITITIKNA
ncbi:MAG: RecQ family ATP-dependent DNA helicase [Prevotella sp.]|nr:RecQ family ATP-dependent DNA helicase [Prevotella sp.]